MRVSVEVLVDDFLANLEDLQSKEKGRASTTTQLQQTRVTDPTNPFPCYSISLQKLAPLLKAGHGRHMLSMRKIRLAYPHTIVLYSADNRDKKTPIMENINVYQSMP